ncbi:MAG: hypothetical protein MUE33_10460 [Cytophagaceae bacterium]|jgi:hypothetical protein|nr:hypothetical protein [Cytophagaceae bacterium]
MKLPFHFFILLFSLGFSFACASGKHKPPKSKRIANATINDDKQFYNADDDAALHEHLDKSKHKRKELEKIHPRELNQDFDVPKSKKKQQPKPQTYY